MRLTLRTLLAYLDDTLEASAAKEIGQKLAETPAAQELVTRIKEVTRRRRLTTPPLTGDEIDPSVLAEYLDSLLSSDEIARVEATCLDSDVHLAEVAACHQILTLIGQPAKVPDSMRERMYSLVGDSESVASERRTAKQEKLGPITPYRFAQRPLLARIVTSAAILLGAVGIGFLVWISLHPQWLGRSSETASVGGPQEAEPSGHFIPTHRESEPSELELPLVPPSESGAPEVARQELDQTKPREPEAPQPMVERPEVPPSDEKARAVTPEEGEKPEPIAAEPAPVVAPPKPEAPEPPKPEPEQPVAVVATYASTSGVLLRPDLTNREWRRVPPRSELHVSERVLCLPWYRAMIQFQSGASLELVGETEVQILPELEGVDGHVRLDRGRLVLGINGARGTFIIEFLEQSWRIVLKSPETSVGLTLVAIWRPGGPFVHEAALLVPRGELELEVAGQRTEVGGPAQIRWDSANGMQDKESLSLPAGWIERDDLTPSEVRAATTLESDLHFDGPIVLSFIDATTNERKDLRLLGMHCLGAVGRLPALIDAMDTAGKRDLRQAAIAALRRYLARGQREEEALFQALLHKFSNSQEHAEGVIALLKGYSDAEFQQMTGKDFENLIALLAADRDLSLRELAILNLEELAGRPLNTAYNPDRPKDSDIAAWRRALDEGRLPPKVRGKM